MKVKKLKWFQFMKGKNNKKKVLILPYNLNKMASRLYATKQKRPL
jgi:hypothetical protein